MYELDKILKSMPNGGTASVEPVYSSTSTYLGNIDWGISIQNGVYYMMEFRVEVL